MICDSADTYRECNFEAVYWAVVTLATVGYGDFHPMTDIGRAISVISALFGVAVVALPASIITAGYLQEMQELQSRSSASDEPPKQNDPTA